MVADGDELSLGLPLSDGPSGDPTGGPPPSVEPGAPPSVEPAAPPEVQDPLIFLRRGVWTDLLALLGDAAMSDLFLLTEAQMRRIEPYFPLSHGVARVDDQRVISGIIFVIRNGLRWRDAPREYGPHKTVYNRFVRWSRLGVFNKIFAELARKGGTPKRLMIDATHLKAHRTAASLLKKGLFPDVSGARRAA